MENRIGSEEIMQIENTSGQTSSPEENCRCRLRWKPTSKAHLSEVEDKILKAYINVPYSTKMVHLSHPKHQLWTLVLNEHHSGTPLVMVHGMGGGIGLWAKNLTELAHTRPVYAFDQLGFARSSRPKFSSKADVAENQFVEAMEEWRKIMKLERFILLGHSLGGFLASAYSLKYPERVCHLIPADPWGFHEKPPQTEIPTRYKVILGIGSLFYPLSFMRALGPLGPGLVKKFRSDIQSKFADVITDDTISHYIYHCNARNPSGEAAFKAISLGPFIWANNPMINRLGNLPSELPMTILYGANSWMDKTAGYRLQDIRENSYVAVEKIPEAGHHVYADQSEAFNAVVMEICQAVDKDSIVSHQRLKDIIDSFDLKPEES